MKLYLSATDNLVAIHLEKAYGFRIVCGFHEDAIDFVENFERISPDLASIKFDRGKHDLKCYIPEGK